MARDGWAEKSATRIGLNSFVLKINHSSNQSPDQTKALRTISSSSSIRTDQYFRRTVHMLLAVEDSAKGSRSEAL